MAGGEGSPCGACKFLRRKCVKSCVFAPYFSSEELGASDFEAIHKIFGASNFSKLLHNISSEEQRYDAVVSTSYEAQARLHDPIYGCVSHILALQHQVTHLQAELTFARTRLASSSDGASLTSHYLYSNRNEIPTSSIYSPYGLYSSSNEVPSSLQCPPGDTAFRSDHKISYFTINMHQYCYHLSSPSQQINDLQNDTNLLEEIGDDGGDLQALAFSLDKKT